MESMESKLLVHFELLDRKIEQAKENSELFKLDQLGQLQSFAAKLRPVRDNLKFRQ